MYTIKQTSEIMNLPASTIRYYDKLGLLPFVRRSETGYRLFSEEDLGLLRVIECLKQTGMPVKEIKQFTFWLQQGDATLQQRYEMFLERRKAVQAQMEQLKKTLEVIDYKCRYYEAALAAGTEAACPAEDTRDR